MAKFFKFLWAQDGDKTTIPNTVQSDGSVSYDEGFGFDYQRPNDGSDPLAKDPQRQSFNALMNDVTTNLQQYQINGFPLFITTSDNGGTPWAYDQESVVRYDDGTGGGIKLYISLADGNTALPSDITKWLTFGVSGVATGMIFDYDFSDLLPGYVWANGSTIGDASSNATGRANIDTFALFTKYWNEAQYQYSGTTADPTLGQKQLYNSAGTAVVRGANSLADWNAHKAIAVLDRRGRTSFGKDNMGPTGYAAANRLTGLSHGLNGSLLGATGGEQGHVIIGIELPSDALGIAGTTLYATSPAHSIGVANTHGGGSVPGWNVQPTDPGTNTPHNTVPPGAVCNVIIKL